MKFPFIILIVLLFSFGLSADAHQIKTDHGVTVLLHVDPSDEPVSGTTTHMYFVFTGSENNIKPDDCNCVAYIAPYSELKNIEEKGSTYNFSQAERIMGSYSISHVFPRHDVYAVVLEGTPRQGAGFEAFRIIYDLRVATGDELPLIPVEVAEGTIDHTYILGSALIVLLALISISIWFFHRRRKLWNEPL